MRVSTHKHDHCLTALAATQLDHHMSGYPHTVHQVLTLKFLNVAQMSHQLTHIVWAGLHVQGVHGLP